DEAREFLATSSLSLLRELQQQQQLQLHQHTSSSSSERKRMRSVANAARKELE
ncbi:unnamed protein product, partial [Amoebophrya sp. A25]